MPRTRIARPFCTFVLFAVLFFSIHAIAQTAGGIL